MGWVGGYGHDELNGIIFWRERESKKGEVEGKASELAQYRDFAEETYARLAYA